MKSDWEKNIGNLFTLDRHADNREGSLRIGELWKQCRMLDEVSSIQPWSHIFHAMKPIAYCFVVFRFARCCPGGPVDETSEIPFALSSRYMDFFDRRSPLHFRHQPRVHTFGTLVWQSTVNQSFSILEYSSKIISRAGNASSRGCHFVSS